MPSPTFPEKMQPEDELRIIAPAFSLHILSQEVRTIAKNRLVEECGLNVTFGERAHEYDRATNSSSVSARIDDLHEGFLDPNVRGIMSAIGGYNSNQLLSYVDWGILRENPKVFCGFSDMTVLGNAIFAMTGLVTYSGPHFSSFGQKKFDSYTLESFMAACFNTDQLRLEEAASWSDDETWYLDQDNRQIYDNSGHWLISPGEAQGTVVGGNLCSYNLLQGTPYLPKVDLPIVFIEDTKLSNAGMFDRDLQSLLHAQPIGGLVIGRFQKDSQIDEETIKQIVHSKKTLQGVPVVANVDFGHTMPLATFPIGATANLCVNTAGCEILVNNDREGE